LRLLSPIEAVGVDFAPEVKQQQQKMAGHGSEGAVGQQMIITAPVTRVGSKASTLTDGMVEMEVEMVPAHEKTPTRPCLRPNPEITSSLSDLSNYLNGSSSDTDSNVTMEDIDYCHVAPPCDMYGWNAEWNKHQTASSTCCAPNPQVKKTAKSSLLQRVLSVSRATAVGRRAGFQG